MRQSRTQSSGSSLPYHLGVGQRNAPTALCSGWRLGTRKAGKMKGKLEGDPRRVWLTMNRPSHTNPAAYRGITGATWRHIDCFVTRIRLSLDKGRPYKCWAAYFNWHAYRNAYSLFMIQAVRPGLSGLPHSCGLLLHCLPDL